MSDLRCPRCSTPLDHLRSADVCARCGGVFLGSAVTDTVARALNPASQRTAQDAALGAETVARTKEAAPCPVCRLPMRRYRFGPHLEVDSCHHHGSWYDKGELARLKLALEEGGVAEEIATPAPDPITQGSGLELEERVRNKAPAPRPLSGAIDPGVQQKINDLARWEGDEARRRARRAARSERRLFGDRFGDNDYDAIDAVFDVLRFLR